MRSSRGPHARKPFRLLALGSAALVDAGGAVVAEQRRRLALLSLIASGRGNGISRDKLVSILSPESSSESARHALDQLLYYLRQQAGDDVFLGTDGLRLNPDVVTSDVADFEDALDRGETEAAVALYRGPFLDGFHVVDSVEFEEWATSERSRLGARHVDALFRLAAAADSRSDHSASIKWWNRLAGLDPVGARAAFGLIRAHAAAGDIPAALRHAAIYDSIVRNEFGAEPDRALEALVTELQARKRTPVTDKREHFADVAATANDAPRSRRKASAATWSVAVLVVSVAAIFGVQLFTAGPAPTPGRIAIMPFRMTGAGSEAAWLREGLVELMAIRLENPRGAAPVDSRLAIASWVRAGGTADHDPPLPAVLAAARQLGAAQAVTGTVVSSGDELRLTAELVDLDTERTVARVEARGRADSILYLVDTIAVRLVSIQGGEDMLRAGVMGATSVTAVRAYLDGRAALRRGDWAAAIGDFDRAVALDSTFASAALGLREASGYSNGERWPFAESLAWRYQGRLTPRERATFVAELGPKYPDYYPAADRLRAWRALVSHDYSNADAWMRLGLTYFHSGARLGVPDAFTEARIALERALELDSTRGVPSRLQLIDIAAVTGDSALMRRVLGAVVVAPADSSTRAYHRWLRAFANRDTVALAAARPGLDQIGNFELVHVWNITQRVGYDVADALRAEAIIKRRARSYNDHAGVASIQYHGALNRGRPSEAQVFAALIAPEWRPLSRLALQALAALYGDADTVAGAAAARALAQEVARPLATDAAELRSQMIHVCVSAQWSLAHGDSRSVDAALAKLRTPEPGALGGIISFYQTCVVAIEAWRAVVDRRPSARVLMERLDSLMLTGPAWHWALPDYRIAARLWDAHGDPVRALAAIRRRRRDVHLYIAPDLAEEGRLALRAGDTSGAVAAWRHYLTVRTDPETSLRPVVEGVRRQLNTLIKHPR